MMPPPSARRNGRADLSGFYSAGQIVMAGHGRQFYDPEVRREALSVFPTNSGRPPVLPFNHPHLS
jgi:hypothetical protein